MKAQKLIHLTRATWDLNTSVCDPLELTPTEDVLFIIGDWNAKVGSQETPGITGKFGLGIQNEAGQRLIVLPRERTGHSKHPLPTRRTQSCAKMWW